jgi:putative ABC transport system ATP-binding protein
MVRYTTRAMDVSPHDQRAVELFVFDHVCVERDGITILDDVHGSVTGPGITVIAGPSGAGKSTLLRLCNRLEVPTTGALRFRGRDLAAIDPRTLRRTVGMVFQTPTLFGGSVRDNLAVAAPAADEERYRAVLEAVALDPGLLDRPAATLSGGEAQRACLARTLVTEPEVLLLDEPTAALDAGPKLTFEQLARGLAAAGMPLLWVTHDVAQLRRIADRVLALVGGALVHAGPVEELRNVAGFAAFLTEGGPDAAR